MPVLNMRTFKGIGRFSQARLSAGKVCVTFSPSGALASQSSRVSGGLIVAGAGDAPREDEADSFRRRAARSLALIIWQSPQECDQRRTSLD